jgi:hypothetical protein
MNISLIVQSFTFNNKNTTVSDDFLNAIKDNNYDTSVFFDYYDTGYVEGCIKIKKPSIIVLVQVSATEQKHYLKDSTLLLHWVFPSICLSKIPIIIQVL